MGGLPKDITKWKYQVDLVPSPFSEPLSALKHRVTSFADHVDIGTQLSHTSVCRFGPQVSPHSLLFLLPGAYRTRLSHSPFLSQASTDVEDRQGVKQLRVLGPVQDRRGHLDAYGCCEPLSGCGVAVALSLCPLLLIVNQTIPSTYNSRDA